MCVGWFLGPSSICAGWDQGHDHDQTKKTPTTAMLAWGERITARKQESVSSEQ